MNLSPQKHPRAEDLEIHTPERMNVIPAKSQPCFAQDLLIKLFRPTFHVLTLVRLEKRPRPFESIKSRLVPGKSAFPISDRSMMGRFILDDVFHTTQLQSKEAEQRFRPVCFMYL